LLEFKSIKDLTSYFPGPGIEGSPSLGQDFINTFWNEDLDDPKLNPLALLLVSKSVLSAYYIGICPPLLYSFNFF
jgi:hypothetical protein